MTDVGICPVCEEKMEEEKRRFYCSSCMIGGVKECADGYGRVWGDLWWCAGLFFDSIEEMRRFLKLRSFQ